MSLSDREVKAIVDKFDDLSKSIMFAGEKIKECVDKIETLENEVALLKQNQPKIINVIRR